MITIKKHNKKDWSKKHKKNNDNNDVDVSAVEDPSCRLIKALVVVNELEDVAIPVENIACLPEPAKKIDRIAATVRDLECDVVNDRVIISGTLHKQIFFVNKDEHVVHHGEDVPFTASVDIEGVEEDNICQVSDIEVKVRWNLLRASRLQQFATITIGLIKVLDEEQVFMPQLGSIEGTVECENNNREEILFAKLKLFDDEGRLIDKKVLFADELDEMKHKKKDNEIEFRFTSLPPGTYELKVFALCCDVDDLRRKRIRWPWSGCGSGLHDKDDCPAPCSLFCEKIKVEVENCEVTVLDIELDDECEKNDLEDIFREILVLLLLTKTIKCEFDELLD